jgi:hypothetical protein
MRLRPAAFLVLVGLIACLSACAPQVRGADQPADDRKTMSTGYSSGMSGNGGGY